MPPLNIMDTCPFCGADDITDPDIDGWQFCNNCGTDFNPDTYYLDE